MDQAMRCLALLIGTTGSWTDDHVDAYAAAISKWKDYPAAQQACDEVALGWTRGGRPPLGVLREAYDDVMRQRRVQYEALAEGIEAPTREQARSAFLRGYEEKCRREGKQPNPIYAERLFVRLFSSESKRPS